MRKNAKSIVAKALVFTLALSVVGIQSPDAEAAKKPKLSTKKVTVTVKKSKKVTIKNVKAKKVKKLTVKTSKKKIATVKRKGKTAFTITGKKAGKATVTAKVKVGKKTTTLKVKVTVKKEAPKPTKAPTAAPTAAPTVAPTAAPTVAPTAAPTVAPTAVPTAAPTTVPDNHRITGKSDVENPIINNITIWGLRDNPYAETGYDYTQYGPFTGIFTKWYEPKASFKALDALFNPTTAKALNSMKQKAAAAEAQATPDPVGTVSDTSVKTTLTYISGPDSNPTVETYAIDATNRTSVSNENQRVTIVDGETLAESGTTVNPAVKISGRANNWHGVQFDITEFITDPTKDYKLSMEIYHNVPAHNRSQFYTQMCFQDDEGNESEDRPTLVMQAATAGEWKLYSANFSTNGYNAEHFVMFANWYGNTTTHDDFYVRNVTVREIYSENVYDTTEILSYSPLYINTEKDFGFSFGGVIGNAAFKDQNYKDVLDKHFSSMTVDNDLKMYSLLDETATKESTDGMPVLRKDGSGEAMVAWAHEKGIGVRGHTIVCDTAMSTNCKYFFHEDYDVTKPLASREVVLQRLESFVTQCISYFEEKYPGTIHSWDVVNEAISTTNGDYDKNDDRKIQIGDNMFYDTIGSDYVEYSFLYARKAVNALKAKYPDRNVNIQLIYNDFNCFQRTKRDAICALVKSIQTLGNSQGMGNLIDGVGMQCYIGYKGGEFPANILTTNPKRTADSIPNAVFMFNELGCKVQFTEVSIRNYDETQNDAQAEYYKKFMQMAIDINNGTMQPVL